MLPETQNGLAIIGSLFLLGGFAILGGILIGRTMLAAFPSSGLMNPGRASVAAGFALPVIAGGFLLQAIGNLVPVAIGPGLTILALALALSLLLFLMLDETIAGSALTSVAAKPAEHALSLAAPVPESRERPAAVKSEHPPALDLAG